MVTSPVIAEQSQAEKAFAAQIRQDIKDMGLKPTFTAQLQGHVDESLQKAMKQLAGKPVGHFKVESENVNTNVKKLVLVPKEGPHPKAAAITEAVTAANTNNTSATAPHKA